MSSKGFCFEISQVFKFYLTLKSILRNETDSDIERLVVPKGEGDGAGEGWMGSFGLAYAN